MGFTKDNILSIVGKRIDKHYNKSEKRFVDFHKRVNLCENQLKILGTNTLDKMQSDIRILNETNKEATAFNQEQYNKLAESINEINRQFEKFRYDNEVINIKNLEDFANINHELANQSKEIKWMRKFF